MAVHLARRDFVAGSLAAAAALALRPFRAWAADSSLPQKALDESPFVYVSPLKSDGKESSCHAEVWFAWIDGAVVMIVSSEGWKATAVGRKLDRARIWVGDKGRLKGINAGSQAFRELPSFDARAETLRDEALLERMLEVYDKKYPDEIGKWKPRFRKGLADGSRVLVRYVPA